MQMLDEVVLAAVLRSGSGWWSSSRNGSAAIRGSGLVRSAIMTAFGALVLFGGRSETIRGLRGDGRDERFRAIDNRATAIAGLAVITAIIVAFVVELARGQTGSRTWLGAIAGLAYLAAIVVFRVRG